MSPRAPYYPEYEPKDAWRFAAMLKIFGEAETHKVLKDMTMLYILDMSYAREDILVALGRIEREKGWK